MEQEIKNQGSEAAKAIPEPGKSAVQEPGNAVLAEEELTEENLEEISGGHGVPPPHKCWIAEAIYGVDDTRTHLVRAWLNGPFGETLIGSAVMATYGATGQEIAAVARRSSLLRAALKPLFDCALRNAMQRYPEGLSDAQYSRDCSAVMTRLRAAQVDGSRTAAQV